MVAADKPQPQTTDRPAEQTQPNFQPEIFSARFNDLPKATDTAAQAGLPNANWGTDSVGTTTAEKLQPQFNQLESTQEAVLKAQGFKETRDAAGAVTRTYETAALKGVSHTFNGDGSTNLNFADTSLQSQLPEKDRFSSMTFKNGETLVGVKGADGKVEMKPATEAQLKEANRIFAGAGGEFTMPDGTTKGAFKYTDARGGTEVAQVPGVPGAEMKLAPPNSQDDLRYTATVKPNGDEPGYKTEATGSKETGLRFVDFDDKTASKNYPKASDGTSIEGLVLGRTPTAERPPLVLKSENQAGDGSETRIGRNMVSDTVFPPGDPQGRLRELKAPADHPSGIVSETEYAPSPQNDGLMLKSVNRDGSTKTERQVTTGDPTKPGYEISAIAPDGRQQVTGFQSTEDAKAGKAAWTRATAADGTVSTTYPANNADGIASSDYKPGPPAQYTFKKADGTAFTPEEAAKVKTPPVVQSEQLDANRTREVRADGTTVTTDKSTGRTVTETAAGATTNWEAGKGPKNAAEFKQATGLDLNLSDQQFKDIKDFGNVTGFTRNNDGTVTLQLDKAKTDHGRSAMRIGLDGSGKPQVRAQDGLEKGPDGKDRHYVESTDAATGNRTRSFDADPSKGQKPGQGDVSVTSPDGKVIFSRTTDGDKITTVDAQKNRTETRDYKAGTWEAKQGDVVTKGTIERGESGQFLFKDADGKLTGMEFTQGRRAGESYKFTRDANGKMTGMEIDIPPRNGQPAQHVSVERNQDGSWQTNPKGQKVPGFDKAVADASGKIPGDFSTNEKGDLVFESADKNIKEIVRGNGGRDTYDMREYSRIRENPDGTIGPKKFWDGYGSKGNPEDGWREGTATTVNGKTTVVFKDQAFNRPTKMTRDTSAKSDGTASNGYEVEFSNGSKFTVGDWKAGKMTYTNNGQTDTLYNTGSVGRDGRVQWAKGTQDASGVVTFDDPRVATSEIPKTAMIDPKTGEIDALYKDERRVTTDGAGQPKRIVTHKGAEAITPIYGINGEFRGYQQGDRQILKGKSIPADQSTPPGTSEWTIKRGDKVEASFTGTHVEKPGGAFDIVGKNGDKYESNGRLTTKEGNVPTVYDARGQKWQMTKPGDGTTKPTWTVDGKSFNGDMKMYDNGNVGVTGTDGNVAMVNPDKSVSTIDKSGIEIGRKFPDGSSLKRDGNGALTEMTRALPDGKTETTTFKYEPLPEGQLALTQVETKGPNGTRLEKPKDGKLREAVLGPDGKEKNPPEFKSGEVTYDRMGVRTETNGTTRVSTDITGKQRTMTVDAQGRIVESPDTAGSGKFKFNYADNNDVAPTEILDAQGQKVGARLSAPATSEEARRNPAAVEAVYDVGGKLMRLDLKSGELKPMGDNRGLDPNIANHADKPASPETGISEAQAKELTDKYGLNPAVIAKMQQLALDLRLPAGVITPQNLDAFFDAASKTPEALNSFKGDQFNQTAKDLQDMLQKQGGPEFVHLLLANPQQIAERLKTPEAFADAQKNFPASFRPLITPQFFKAYDEARKARQQQQPPGPDPRRP